MNKDAIKVLVVDDSAFMRRVLTDILNEDEEIEVLDTARNGKEAIEKVKSLKPDIVTLDVEMPIMDGLESLKEILKIINGNVIMISSVTKEGAKETLTALAEGAFDFITKPDNISDITTGQKKNQIIQTVKLAKSALKKGQRSDYSNIKVEVNSPIIPKNNGDLKGIVAIGTSTGGPKALQNVIPLINGNLPIAVLVVQHMPAGFTKSLSERLDAMSNFKVKEAQDDDIVVPGTVYVAPGGYQMLIEKHKSNLLKIKITKDPPVSGHRPCVDVMFKSLADTGMSNITAVVMTGMGADGSQGIRKLKEINNAYIIAQDEDSSVVYGMPKMAVNTGVVDVIVPLKEIANEIMKSVEVYK